MYIFKQIYKMFCIIRRVATRRYLDPLFNFQYSVFSTARNIFLTPAAVPNLEICRFKSKKSKIQSQVTNSESDKESEGGDDLIEDKYTKNVKISVPSMRLDTIIKASLGVARNKVDIIFYENKVRVNGEKVNKKSISCHNGDEIDVIKGVNVMNPDFLTVARIEILSAEVEGDKIELKIRRNKSLTIDNYGGTNSYK